MSDRLGGRRGGRGGHRGSRGGRGVRIVDMPYFTSDHISTENHGSPTRSGVVDSFVHDSEDVSHTWSPTREDDNSDDSPSSLCSMTSELYEPQKKCQDQLRPSSSSWIWSSNSDPAAVEYLRQEIKELHSQNVTLLERQQQMEQQIEEIKQKLQQSVQEMKQKMKRMMQMMMASQQPVQQRMLPPTDSDDVMR